MIRIFYDPATGEIHSATTAAFAGDLDLPYIDVEQQVRISDWKVNIQTKELEALPSSEVIARSGRR